MSRDNDDSGCNGGVVGISGKVRLGLVSVAVVASVAAGTALVFTWESGQFRVRDWLRQLGAPSCEPSSRPAMPVRVRGRPADWRLEYKQEEAETSSLSTVDGSGPRNVWATGYQGSWEGPDRPLVVRHDGSGWREVTMPAGYGVARAAEVSTTAAGAWVLPSKGVVLHWNGSRWERHSFPESLGGGLDAVADDDVWYASMTDGHDAVARHWNGRSWSRTKLPGNPDSISRVVGRTHDEVWVAGGKGERQPLRLYLARWSGGKWREVAAPPVAAPCVTDDQEDREVYYKGFAAAPATRPWALVTSSSDDVYRTFLYQFRDGAWRQVAIPSDLAEYESLRMAVDEQGKVWLASESGRVFRRVGRRWQDWGSPVTTGMVMLEGISVAGGVVRVTGNVGSGEEGPYNAVIYAARTDAA